MLRHWVKLLFPLILVAGSGVAAVGDAGAANLAFYGLIPGAGTVTKSVQSMRERRYRNLVRQKTDYTCGAAAIATILKFGYGLDTSEEAVLRGLLSVADAARARAEGFSMLDMKRYLKTMGFRGRGYELPEQFLERLRMPVIVLLDIKGYRHFVVFQKARNGKVYYADPALGNKVMDRAEFLAAWNGIAFAVVREDFDRESVLLQPRGPLQADKEMTLLYDALRETASTDISGANVQRDFTCIFCF